MAIDTIYDPAATWYIDMNSNVQSYIESYNVAAFDECFINGEPDPGAASPYCASRPVSECLDGIVLRPSHVVLGGRVQLGFGSSELPHLD